MEPLPKDISRRIDAISINTTRGTLCRISLLRTTCKEYYEHLSDYITEVSKVYPDIHLYNRPLIRKLLKKYKYIARPITSLMIFTPEEALELLKEINAREGYDNIIQGILTRYPVLPRVFVKPYDWVLRYNDKPATHYNFHYRFLKPKFRWLSSYLALNIKCKNNVKKHNNTCVGDYDNAMDALIRAGFPPEYCKDCLVIQWHWTSLIEYTFDPATDEYTGVDKNTL